MRRHVAACLYLDNQDEAQFPLDTVIASVGFADTWLFVASDEANAAHLRSLGPTTVTGIHIRESSDISRAMNAAFLAARAQTDADIVVLVQADTLSTPAVDAFVRDYAGRMDLTKARWLTALDVRLYYGFQAGWGYSLVGRDWTGSFIADGLSTQAAFVKEEEARAGRAAPPSCLHIGYLSTEFARRHIRLNARLWGVPEQVAVIDGLNAEDFVRWCLPHIRQHTPGNVLEPIAARGPHYEHVIDQLGLREDQAFVYSVVQDATREKV